MDIGGETITWGVSMVLSAGVAFGILKGKMYNYITYEKHREICAKEREETNRVLSKLYDAEKETHGMIKEIHGYLKAKNNGKL